jgi:hypothetical protein
MCEKVVMLIHLGDPPGESAFPVAASAMIVYFWSTLGNALTGSDNSWFLRMMKAKAWHPWGVVHICMKSLPGEPEKWSSNNDKILDVIPREIA